MKAGFGFESEGFGVYRAGFKNLAVGFGGVNCELAKGDKKFLGLGFRG